MQNHRRMSDEDRARAKAHRKAVGRRIKEAREKRGLSQSQLAARVGVEAQTISKQERGVFSPAADTLLKIADVCGVDPRWLVLVEAPSDEDAPDEPALAPTGTDGR